MDKDIVITAEIMDAVKDMASVMVTCRISVLDPMRKLGLLSGLYFSESIGKDIIVGFVITLVEWKSLFINSPVSITMNVAQIYK